MEDSMHAPSGSRESYYTSYLTSIRENEPLNPSLDMKALFYILLKSAIHGPRLVRFDSEFTTRLGQGGEGVVYAASQSFERKAMHEDPRRRTGQSFLASLQQLCDKKATQRRYTTVPRPDTHCIF